MLVRDIEKEDRERRFYNTERGIFFQKNAFCNCKKWQKCVYCVCCVCVACVARVACVASVACVACVACVGCAVRYGISGLQLFFPVVGVLG